MEPTSLSLLERLQHPADQAAWERFVDLYTPLLYAWTRRLGVPDADAADLVQDVLTVLVEKLPAFRYDRRQRFRAWLWTVTHNKWCDRRRKDAAAPPTVPLPELAEPGGDVDREDEEYRRYLVGRALRLMQSDFEATTWKACWEHVVSGRSAADVARQLGISVGAVYVAKSRVLRRLRQELDGLLH